MLAPGTQAPSLEGYDEQGNAVTIPVRGEWTYLWFNPVFGRYGCKECEVSLLHELYPELRMAGLLPFGATFDPPMVNTQRNEPHIWRIPLVQVTKEQAAEWGALREESDAWCEYTPRSVAYILNETGKVIHATSPVNHTSHGREVLRIAQLRSQPQQSTRATPASRKT